MPAPGCETLPAVYVFTEVVGAAFQRPAPVPQGMLAVIFEVVGDIRSQGVTILLVEQNASRALQIASRGYVMESGEITMGGDAKQLRNDPKVRAAYLGE